MVRFFDFYGTIVHRRCSSNELKLIWSQRLSEILNININYKFIYDIRRKEETYLFNNKKPYGEFTYDELCERIYSNFFYDDSLVNITKVCNVEQFKTLSIDLEVSLEQEYQYIDDGIVNEISKLHRDGNRIYIISDFYLSSECIKKFLNYHSIDYLIDGVFVSCDYGLNKYTGTLYQYVLSALDLKANKCFMTGDNRHSDFIMAKKIGINAKWIKTLPDNKILNNTVNKMHYIVNINKKNTQFYSNYAFSLYLFIDRLYRFLKFNNYSEVYFLSREGELLQDLFEQYINNHNYDIIVSKYLYVSRKSTYLPGLKALGDEKFDTIFREFPDLSISSFLKNINFFDNEIDLIESCLSLEVNKVINNFKDSIEFNILKTSKIFSELYEYKRQEQKERFKRYLESVGILDKQRIALVDVGWKGTIQDNIFKFFNGDITIDGIYLGVVTGGETCLNNYKHGLLFSSLPTKSYMYDNMSWGYSWFERLLYATHGSVYSYEEKNGTVEPVLKSFESEFGMYNMIKPIQDSVIDCFNKICNLFTSTDVPVELVLDEFVKIHVNTMLIQPMKFIRLRAQLCSSQYENFGCYTSQSEIEKSRFSLYNIIKNKSKVIYAIINFGKTNDTEKICRMLETKEMFLLLKIVYRIIYMIRIKDICKVVK